MEHLPELMRPIRAFAVIDISKSKGYEAIQRGDIPHVLVAGLIRIPRSWVDAKVKEALARETEAPTTSALTSAVPERAIR